MAKRTGSNSGNTDSETAKAPRAPRGPVLSWTPERDRALVEVMGSGVRVTNQLTSALAEHEAFAGEGNLLTDAKVRLRVKTLQKAGVKIPSIARSRYTVDTAGLNALLGAAGTSDEGEGGSDEDADADADEDFE